MKLSRRGFLGLGVGTAVAAVVRPEINLDPEPVVTISEVATWDGFKPQMIHREISYGSDDSVLDAIAMIQRDIAISIQNDTEDRILNGESE